MKQKDGNGTGRERKMCNGIYKIKQMSTKSISRKINYFQCIEFIILHRVVQFECATRAKLKKPVLERRHILYVCVCASRHSSSTTLCSQFGSNMDYLHSLYWSNGFEVAAHFIRVHHTVVLGHQPTTTKRDLEPRKLHIQTYFRIEWDEYAPV